MPSPSNLPVVPFPSSPPRWLATVDDDGVAVEHCGAPRADLLGLGGSIISVPVNADVGFSDDARQSLQGAYIATGLQGAVDGVESLLRITINFATEMNADQVAAMLQPLGPIPVVLPDEVPAAGPTDVIPAGVHDDLDAPPAGCPRVDGGPCRRGANSPAAPLSKRCGPGGLRRGRGQRRQRRAAVPPGSFDDARAHLFAGHTQTPYQRPRTSPTATA